MLLSRCRSSVFTLPPCSKWPSLRRTTTQPRKKRLRVLQIVELVVFRIQAIMPARQRHHATQAIMKPNRNTANATPFGLETPNAEIVPSSAAQ